MAEPRRRRAWIALAAGVGVVLTYLLWPARRPSVLLITIDSLRPDFLSCYGSARYATPRIDALAAAGVLFAQAICDVPWTRASMASVMTGRYATAHRVRSLYERLSAGNLTMAETFRKAGYLTGAIVSTFQLDHVFQLDQGFDTYDDRFDAALLPSTTRPLHMASIFYGDLRDDRAFRRGKLLNDSLRGDALSSDAAIGWLRRVGERRFFLWVHYSGPDPSEKVAKHPRSALPTDNDIGRLLQALADLGLDQDTLVVLHADHAQSMLAHSRYGQGTDLYESSLHVPLLMRWPRGLPAGRRVNALVRLVDVFPTVADLAGLPAPAPVDGHSIASLARGTDERGANEVYCETFLSAAAAASRETTGPDGSPLRFGFVRRGIRSERWKYIRNEPSSLIDVPSPADVPEEVRRALMSEELYDLMHDPEERQNVIDREAATAAELRTRLEGYMRRPQPTG